MMKFVKFILPFLAVLPLIGVSTTLSAAQEEQGWREAPWRFNAKVYGWLPEAPADIEIDQHEVAFLPESLDNILDDLDLTAMLEFEAHKGKLGFFISPVYYDGKDTEHFDGVPGERRKFTLEESVWVVDYGVAYEIGQWRLGEAADSPTVTVEPFVGGLYFHDKIKIDVTPGLLDRGLRIRKTIEFNTPIVGLNALLRFNDRWSFRVSGNYGGFHISDVNKTWQGIGLLGYHFKIKKTSSQFFVGYRYLHLDYEDDPLAINVDVKGPLVGFGVEF
jgi:hypothetical protein